MQNQDDMLINYIVKIKVTFATFRGHQDQKAEVDPQDHEYV